VYFFLDAYSLSGGQNVYGDTNVHFLIYKSPLQDPRTVDIHDPALAPRL
jgi:hypothetical protein